MDYTNQLVLTGAINDVGAPQEKMLERAVDWGSSLTGILPSGITGHGSQILPSVATETTITILNEMEN